MLLTLTLTSPSATNLGYLLHKHPARLHRFDLAFGAAYVFYPEASDDRCTAALLLDVDPVTLVRGSGDSEGWVAQYVNDRPYVASSFMSVALSRVFGTAMAGTSKERQTLADSELALEVSLPIVASRGGDRIIHDLFEPLGYGVQSEPIVLDDDHPEWGPSRYRAVRLSGTKRLRDLLTHLYVMLPVLDDEKHYYVGDDEVEKLLRRGEGWLATHPHRELIAFRYLKHRRSLTNAAIARLVAREDVTEPDVIAEQQTREEDVLEEKLSLNEQRLAAVADQVSKLGATSVVDLGCGEGKLLRALVKRRAITRLVGVDVSHRALETAADRLHLERMHEKDRARVRLLHGSLVYRDARLSGFDVATVVEVIEHLDASRLSAFERTLFEFARPKNVILTTPNVEYNVKWDTLPRGTFRHKDHRFEWTRAELIAWGNAVAGRFGYSVTYLPVGPVDEVVGSPTQMAVFTS